MSRPNSSGPSLSSMYHLLRSGRLTDCRERWSRKAQIRSGGTEGSNAAPSSGESNELPYATTAPEQTGIRSCSSASNRVEKLAATGVDRAARLRAMCAALNRYIFRFHPRDVGSMEWRAQMEKSKQTAKPPWKRRRRGDWAALPHFSAKKP